MATNIAVTGETPIAIKISVNDSLKKLKLPLKDLGADTLPTKLRLLLGIAADREVVFERFSDSAGGYILLDTRNPTVFKTLIRAAKAKLKLRLKATITPNSDDLAAAKAENFMAEMPNKEQEPVIARTPAYESAARHSTALDCRSIGSGIFQFKEARATDSQTASAENENEAPVPHAFNVAKPDLNNITEALANLGLGNDTMPLHAGSAAIGLSSPAAWSVYCNECDTAMDNAHFHCSICDGGDYDLCESCVGGGKLCPGEDHWLVKRFVKDGKVISSTTERLAPKPKTSLATTTKTKDVAEMPGSFAEDLKSRFSDSLKPSRTCNSCVSIKEETEFVTCTLCEDFDLCLDCHSQNEHGHHPAHSFVPSTPATDLSLLQKSLLAAGRNVRHHAICDGCDKTIYGVRHKCFTCPDFDYCNQCIMEARTIHPQHRFAALYQPIPLDSKPAVRHHGIYCDGPICSAKPNQGYIAGVRYKCVVCHDTDFCADCEALPRSSHNATHPLIKIKTPIRGLNVSTVSENPEGMVRGLGDKKSEQIKKESTSPAPSLSGASATSAVQTVADIKPTVATTTATSASSTADVNAHFVHDTVPDGLAVAPSSRFTQVWTLRNPGPNVWPAGCSVRYVGGDNMLNLDNNHASSASDVAEATESNVIGREVQVGEEVAFKVTMKAPVRQGKAISYWRLKTANGTPFGHRLWCDVSVTAVPVVKQQIAADAAAIDAAMAESPASAQGFSKRGNVSRADALRQHQQRLASMPGPRSYYEQYQQRMDAMRHAQEKMRSEQMRSQVELMRAEVARKRQLSMEKSSDEAFAPYLAQAGPPPPYNSDFTLSGKSNHYGLSHTSAMPSWKQQLENFVQRTSSSKLTPNAAHSPSTSSPIETKPDVEPAQVKESEQKQPELKTKTSQMIFPTLDRESPASSTYQSMTSSHTSKGKAAYVEDEETGVKVADAAKEATPATEGSKPEPISAPVSETASLTTSAANDGFEDLGDELEVFSADGEVSEDDGFLTDEEYDILDASDQETVASMK